MANTGTPPSLKEKFKYVLQSRGSHCGICAARIGTGTRSQIGAERALWIYLKHRVLLHPKRDFVCTNGPNSCDAKSITDLRLSYTNISNKQLIDNFRDNKRIPHNLAGIFQSAFFKKLLKNHFENANDEESKSSHLDFDRVSDHQCTHLTTFTKQQISDVATFILHRIKRTGKSARN